MQSIEASQVLIPVFSKNYADSSWCLEELAKIVDCMKRQTGQTVMPVFYDVRPSKVRKQRGGYGKAFADHEARFQHDLEMVQRWRASLIQVAGLSGFDVHNKKPENEEIETIVKRVKSILDRKLSGLDGLVGMDSRVEQVEKFLGIDSDDDSVRVVGICGMGGIGKTTLAREVYRRNSHQFDAKCYIDDVCKVYRGGGLLATQKQLICQSLKEETQEIWNVSDATHLIKTRLRLRKTLIVLDNVDENEQLDKLGVKPECLCPGSRMLVISRDRHILNNYGVDEVYDAKLLHGDEAWQLFCRKAFKDDRLMSCDEDIHREYEKLTDLALEYAQGLPLAIEVLGSFLCGRTLCEWKSALTRLRDNPKREIMDVLRISFDALEPMEKQIFLDIACFIYTPYKMSPLDKILDYRKLHRDIEMRVLLDKSLITKNEDGGDIEMHDMLQELGMNIVRQEAPDEPGKWSRIWRVEDFECLMFEKMNMDNIQFILLLEPLTPYPPLLSAEAISRMNQLRFLKLEGVNFWGSLNYLSKELRYLDWYKYPFTYFPLDCELINLVELHLRGSSIKQLWEGTKPLPKLKYIDLSYSEDLLRTPDLSGAPNLEELFLERCTKLEHIHPSIGLLKKLVHLNLRGCKSLTSLPSRISDGHNNKDNVGSQMPSSQPRFYYCLKHLDLSYCSLVDIPESVASLSCLVELYLAGNNFAALPSFLAKLPRLKRLSLGDCNQLAFLPEFPLRTTDFQVEEFRSVELSLFNCPKLVEMESFLSSGAVSWMIRVLKVHKESSPGISIVIPGTQIPSWFNRPNVGGSISIGSFLNVDDSNFIGIAFCASFYMVRHSQQTSGIYYASPTVLITCKLRFGFSSVVSHYLSHDLQRNEVTNELVHLCLFYVTRQQLLRHYSIKMKKNIMWRDAADTLHFDVSLATLGKDLGFKVNNCGVRVVFKQDLEELVSDQ